MTIYNLYIRFPNFQETHKGTFSSLELAKKFGDEQVKLGWSSTIYQGELDSFADDVKWFCNSSSDWKWIEI